jgi:hypothetical protein
VPLSTQFLNGFQRERGGNELKKTMQLKFCVFEFVFAFRKCTACLICVAQSLLFALFVFVTAFETV